MSRSHSLMSPRLAPPASPRTQRSPKRAHSMMTVLHVVLWLGALFLVGFPVSFLIAEWNTDVYRYSLMGSWFGTIAGVIAGVPIALQLARLQQRTQEDATARQQQLKKQELLSATRHRLGQELSFNMDTVDRLRRVLAESPHSRVDVWTWAARVAESLEFTAWAEFDAIPLTEDERTSFAEITSAYRKLRRLQHEVSQGLAAHSFVLGYSANEVRADAILTAVRASTDSTYSLVSSACAE